MSYRFSKVSAQTDVTSASLPVPPNFLLMKGVPAVILSLDSSCDGRWPALLQVSTHTFAGGDSPKCSSLYLLGLSNTQDKLDPMLEEMEVTSDIRFSVGASRRQTMPGVSRAEPSKLFLKESIRASTEKPWSYF